MNGATLGAIVATAFLLVAACTRAPDVPFVGTPPPASATVDPSEVPNGVPSDSPVQATVVPAEILPVEGVVLPIAARDGAPGLVACGFGPFAFEELGGPWGAETLVGPEYDVLRQTIAQYGKRGDPEFESLGRATFTVAYRDGTTVGFLGNVGRPEGWFASVTAGFDGAEWRWAGMDGACLMTGAPGKGWDGALWDVDPSFRQPTAKTRKLHLLVREIYCAANVPIAGRVSPVWVFLEPDKVRMQVFVRSVGARGSCEGVDPMPVTVTLPEPLGDRALKDVVNHDICYGCGG